MPRGVDGLQGPAVAGHDLAVGQPVTGDEGGVDPFPGGIGVGVRHRLGTVGLRITEDDAIVGIVDGHRAVRAEAVGGRTGPVLEGGHPAGVVGMRMGDHDRGHVLAGIQGAEDGVEMGGQIGAGVDDRHRAPADEIGASTGERELAGVGGHHTADER